MNGEKFLNKKAHSCIVKVSIGNYMFITVSGFGIKSQSELINKHGLFIVKKL